MPDTRPAGTLREHLEAILDRPFDDPAWNKLALQHAVAALAEWDRLIDRLGHAERGISFHGDSKSILQQIIAADSEPSA